MITNFRLLALAGALLAAWPAPPASATTLSRLACGQAQLDAFDGALACARGEWSRGNRQPDAGDLNGAAFFGFGDWTHLAKDDDLDGTDSGPFPASLAISAAEGDDPRKSGVWTVSDTSWASYMLVFKGGSVPFVAYLLDAATGGYASPLFKRNGKAHAISNVALYARGEPTPPIPLPFGAVLIGTAFAGAGLVSARARRRKQAA